jgi:hypothetical protein
LTVRPGERDFTVQFDVRIVKSLGGVVNSQYLAKSHEKFCRGFLSFAKQARHEGFSQ